MIGVRGLTLCDPGRAYPKYGMIATIDPSAEARFSASIMIREPPSTPRFGGREHVGWTTKQLTPRTFSPIST